MPNFTTRLSLSASSYPDQFHCAYSHNGALRMIDFNNRAISTPSGNFTPGVNNAIDLPTDMFDKLASNVNSGSPKITIETNPHSEVTNFDPGKQPSVPLSVVFQSSKIITCLYGYMDPTLWELAWMEVDFKNPRLAVPAPSGVFVVGQTSEISLPPDLMTKLAADLSPPPGQQTVVAIDTDPLGNVRGFQSRIELMP